MVTKDRVAFADNDDSMEQAAEQVLRKGVKINNAKSKFGKQAAEKQMFAENADSAVAGDLDRKTRAIQLVNKFWQVVQDKTLAENKGPLQMSVEAQLVKDLIGFANEMNNDPNEIEGTGSVAIITLLVKTMLKTRDSNNESAFKIQKLEKNVSQLSSQVEQLLKTNDKS